VTSATPPPMYTPRQIAERYAVAVDVVYSWIRAGELPARDASSTRGGKARWRVDPADLLIFDQARSNRPTPKPSRRRKPDPAVTEYF